ncbi:thioesterase family protein [Acinetobacter wuhouensis]|uniref:thioesterase family protein n=1 Tax=Acinetobacter wuhouensis TaxID=1879050 RepID=UPI00083A0428|nr:thioesterase family protein [Acinetobacter wuhouensis]AXQ20926.1 thioesterase family protein [Acinetobacter wuhouensis]
MSLEQLFQQIERQQWIDIPQGWLQGRTIFGGLVAGMLIYKATTTINDSEKKLLSCSVTFVGPVDEAQVNLTAEILREGKSVTTIEVRLWQNDAVQSILIASFGSQRESKINVPLGVQPIEFPPIDQLNIVPKYLPFPECVKNFQLAWTDGHYPMSGSKEPDFKGCCRFDPEVHANREMNLADLVTLMDVWPPGVLPMFRKPAPASSLTWHLTFIHPLQSQLNDWFKYHVITDFAEHGYSAEHAYLWDAQNRLIAIARQTVTVFA